MKYRLNPVGRVLHRETCKLSRPEWKFDWLDGCTAREVKAFLKLRPEFVPCRRCKPDKARRT